MTWICTVCNNLIFHVQQSTLKRKIVEFANRLDPAEAAHDDEAAQHEQPHLDLLCLPASL